MLFRTTQDEQRLRMETRQVINTLSREVLRISHKYRLSHIGSCLTVLPILYDIYTTKKPDDRVVLSAGHSGLALYVVLEHFGWLPDAEATLVRDGIHPVRNEVEHIDCSTGSLGQGITVGVGMALARPDRQVYVVSTDGEMAEGSWWESVYFGSKAMLSNLHVHVNVNGWTALEKAPWGIFDWSDDAGHCVTSHATHGSVPQHLSWFQGLEQHYHVMTESEYREIDAYYAAL